MASPTHTEISHEESISSSLKDDIKELLGEIRGQKRELKTLRDEVRENSFSVSSEVKKLKSEKEIRWKYEGNRIQYEFNSELDEQLKQGFWAIENGKAEYAVDILKESREKIQVRNKHIRIADTTEGGWDTVKHYVSNPLASNSEDESRINRSDMFYRFGRNVRPLICKVYQRPLSSKRDLPITASWRNPRFGVWREARDSDRNFEDPRDMNRMGSQRFGVWREARDSDRNFEDPRDMNRMGSQRFGVWREARDSDRNFEDPRDMNRMGSQMFGVWREARDSDRNFEDPRDMNRMGSQMFGVWREARDSDRKFEDPRDMNRMGSQRFWDPYFMPSRGTEVRSEVPKLTYNSEVFELTLDVQQFSPSDLNVKLAGNTLTVRGKHEQKEDEHGHISREFHRELTLPEGVDIDSMTSSVSEDGFLTIRADVKGAEKPPEQVIDIQREQKDSRKEQNTD